MSVWRFVEELVDDRRLFASEEVKEEASNPELVDLFTRKPEMVVDLASVQLYVNRFIIESAQAGLLLNDPNNPDKNRADPFVITVALALEMRRLDNLLARTNAAAKCMVICYENRAGQGARLPKIPNVCDHFDLECVDWPWVLANEGITM